VGFLGYKFMQFLCFMTGGGASSHGFPGTAWEPVNHLLFKENGGFKASLLVGERFGERFVV
jgi:hypothetical protein